MDSIADSLPGQWKEETCQCGLGEPHYRYERSDCGTVCRDHGRSGDNLKNVWIGCDRYSDQTLSPHKTAQAAIKKLDSLYPVED